MKMVVKVKQEARQEVELPFELPEVELPEVEPPEIPEIPSPPEITEDIQDYSVFDRMAELDGIGEDMSVRTMRENPCYGCEEDLIG